MLGGGATIGYSTTSTDSVGGKIIGTFAGTDRRGKQVTGGSGPESPLVPSRMHLVDSWRESFMNRSYDKHVS